MKELHIRHTQTTDAQGLYELMTGTDAYQQTLQLPNPSLDMWQKRLAHIPDNTYSYVAILNQQVVGNIFIEVHPSPRRKHTARLGMTVKDGFHGQGIGKKLMQTIVDLADNWLNLTRLELTVYTDNEKAIKLYQNFGFIIEGEAVDFAFRNGQFINAYYMARIKPSN